MLTNISIKMVLRISFLFFLWTKIQFVKKEIICRNYMVVKTLFTTKEVKLIDKQEFTRVIIDKNFKIFVIYIAALEVLLKLFGIIIHLF